MVTLLLQMQVALPQQKFEFVGKALCLDFCNTVGGKRGGIAREKLRSYLDLVSWAEQAGLLTPQQARVLDRKAAAEPGEAAAVLARAIELRESVYRIMFAVCRGKAVGKTDLANVNEALAQTQGRLRVRCIRAPAGFAWEWLADEPALDNPLGPLARSAADLLTSSQQLRRVRQCQGENCGWVFIDTSKNHSRRWCDMRDCGNRAKVRRHRSRQRG